MHKTLLFYVYIYRNNYTGAGILATSVTVALSMIIIFISLSWNFFESATTNNVYEQFDITVCYIFHRFYNNYNIGLIIM